MQACPRRRQQQQHACLSACNSLEPALRALKVDDPPRMHACMHTCTQACMHDRHTCHCISMRLLKRGAVVVVTTAARNTHPRPLLL
eukprot:365779-Chlamydomonas_euryale.AAC.3